MEQSPTSPEKQADFESWRSSISRLATMENVYMKLSGGFSEIADQDPSHPWPVSKLLERTRPWIDHVFSSFSPRRIMFGSDWPVCNVRGPGDNLAWGHWRDFVEAFLEEKGLSGEERDMIWFGTAVKAYNLELDEN
jgi:L-rhamnono-1,4-lactonase